MPRGAVGKCWGNICTQEVGVVQVPSHLETFIVENKYDRNQSEQRKSASGQGAGPVWCLSPHQGGKDYGVDKGPGENVTLAAEKGPGAEQLK